MIYPSIGNVFLIHLFIGIGLTGAYAAWCFQKKHLRHLFCFGHGPFGEKPMWIEWYIVAYTFEVITSFLPGTGPLYYEIAISIFQAAAFTLGAWLIDRIALLLPTE